MTLYHILLGVAAIIAAGMPGFLAWIQAKKSHKLVNSRLTELLDLTRKSAKAEGKLEGAAEEKQRIGGENTP